MCADIFLDRGANIAEYANKAHGSTGNATLPDMQLSMDRVATLNGVDLDYLAALLRQNMSADPVLRAGLLRNLGDRVVIALPGDLLFAPGSSDLAASGQEALGALADLLRHVTNRIEVSGHADPRPPGGGYESNWDLSLARALRVSAILDRYGAPGRVVARGLGDSRYGTLSPKLAPDQRLELARRIELVIHGFVGELE